MLDSNGFSPFGVNPLLSRQGDCQKKTSGKLVTLKQIADGFGHSSDNSGILCGTIARKMLSGSYSSAVTNRYIWFSLNALQKDPWGALSNTTLLDCWPAYATSSNRLESVNLCIAEGGCSDIISNDVIKVRSELLALPPGTMQMLPTNQFYNVED